MVFKMFTTLRDSVAAVISDMMSDCTKKREMFIFGGVKEGKYSVLVFLKCFSYAVFNFYALF